MIPKTPKLCPPPDQTPSRHRFAGEPLLLTVEEVMDKLRLGRTSIFGLLAAGDKANSEQYLTRVRIGGATRVTMASVLHLAGQLDAGASSDEGEA